MRILVTGGTGVIGTGAVPALLEAGHEVRLLARSARRSAREYPERVEAFAADITAPETLAGAAGGCQIVVHIAGIVEERPPEKSFTRVNVGGTRAMLAEAERAGVIRFVFLSALGADGGRSDYHRSKREAEDWVKRFCGEWVILRPGNVYGPGDDMISTLLKMVRTLPVVPVIDLGHQRFQPIWYRDLAKAVAQSVLAPQVAGKVLRVAGGETTTTRELIDRLNEITGRQPARVPVPSWLAHLGARLDNVLGGTGAELAEQLGLRAPLNSSKLHMLLEENVIDPPEANALTSVFGITPTPLAEGLRMLADELPEVSPAQGVGRVQRKLFWAHITGSDHTPKELLRVFRVRLTELMPLDFAAEPGVATTLDLGHTLTAVLPMRGNIQVRVVEVTDEKVTLATVEGHPLAGAVSFQSSAVGSGIRFQVEVLDRANDVLDWLAMRTVGQWMQNESWIEVVRRVVQISGGAAPAGVEQSSVTLSETEAEAVTEWIEDLVTELKRQQHSTVLDKERR